MTAARRVLWVAAIGIGFGSAMTPLARGDDVLPPGDTPYCYSLADMAVLTAVYNTGFENGSPDTPPPDVPFHILVADATVARGTMFYVPVYYADNSGGAPAGFPTNIRNQVADAVYLDTVTFQTYDIEFLIIQVDGHTTILDDAYIVGVKTAPLLDGPPGGRDYITSAAFLKELSPGKHTVSVGGIIAGEPVAFLTYAVTVK